MSVLRDVTPNLFVLRMDQIDIGDLVQRGIKAVLLDFDNTILPWYAEMPVAECAAWVEKAKEKLQLCIVSNTIRPRRLNHVADTLGIPAVSRWLLGRKPFRGGLAAALAKLGVEAHHTAMVGDQLLTDVLGGNRMGMYTVWVRPLEEREFIGTKITRMFERALERRFARMGMLPEGWD